MPQALITGTGTGIGLACLKKFLQENSTVIAHYYETSDEFETLCANNRSSVTSIKSDFSNEDEIQFFLSHISKMSINVLINIAGCFDFSKTAPNRILAAKKIFCVNTIAPYLIAETIFEKMKTLGSGHIINVSSIGVKYGSSFNSPFYAASKAALEATTRTLAREGAPFNILVNTIRPGVTNTNFISKTGKDINERAKLIPLKRPASPEEITNLIYFLANINTYITGQTIAISGGE